MYVSLKINQNFYTLNIPDDVEYIFDHLCSSVVRLMYFLEILTDDVEGRLDNQQG